ncbi:hypothetical protein BKA60DRAFT_154933 [Fusarium oxysporum]|nr:hypothetical protein BKA60DRAFT_154933 [Fusarium oxysporum]
MEVLIQSGSCARWCQIELYSLRRSTSFSPHFILITAIVHLEIDSISTKNLGRGTIISSHIPESISQAMDDFVEMSQYQKHAKKKVLSILQKQFKIWSGEEYVSCSAASIPHDDSLLMPYLNSLSIHRKDSDTFQSKTLHHS